MIHVEDHHAAHCQMARGIIIVINTVRETTRRRTFFRARSCLCRFEGCSRTPGIRYVSRYIVDVQECIPVPTAVVVVLVVRTYELQQYLSFLTLTCMQTSCRT